MRRLSASVSRMAATNSLYPSNPSFFTSRNRVVVDT